MASKKPTTEQNYASTYWNAQGPLSSQKLGLAKGFLTNQMPKYSQIDFNSPEVQGINQTLDSITASNSRDLYGQDFNTAARSRDFGSSYQAARQAKLQGLLSNQYAQNKLQALQTAQGIQDSNVNQALKFANYYEGVPQPVATSAQQGMGSGGQIATSLGGAAMGAVISALL